MKLFLNEDEGLTSIEYALILMLLIVLCLTLVRYLGYGTRVTADNVTNRTNNSAGAPLPYEPKQAQEPAVEIVHSAQPTSFDGVLFVALICMVTACVFTAACFICYRYMEWRAQQATRQNLHDRTDEDKIDATLDQRLRGRVLNTAVDGPIQDRAVAPVAPPPVVVSHLWWLAPKANLEARAAADFAPSESPILPPHPDMVTGPAKGKVIVFDAASLASVGSKAPVNGGPGAVALPEPPSDS